MKALFMEKGHSKVNTPDSRQRPLFCKVLPPPLPPSLFLPGSTFIGLNAGVVRSRLAPLHCVKSQTMVILSLV